jgi:Arc/MetJ-type ribon-helix-helix transcriptional regulator
MELASIRLPDSLARSIDEIARQRHVTRSDVIREAVEQYCRRSDKRRRLVRVEFLEQLVTYPGSGTGDLAYRGEEYLRRRFRARRHRSR